VKLKSKILVHAKVFRFSGFNLTYLLAGRDSERACVECGGRPPEEYSGVTTKSCKFVERFKEIHLKRYWR